MDIATTTFETPHRSFTLLDAPGHRDFIPNMITGAAQADVGLLVVDAGAGAFEAGFDLGGQTREHALLLRSLGVGQILVAVNKLDTVDWSQQRYGEIEARLADFLTTQAGFKPARVLFLPCSGMAGENLFERREPKLAWYTGPTLVEMMDGLEIPLRPIDKHFRMCVQDFNKGGIIGSGVSGNFTATGRIETGTLQVGEDVLLVPSSERGVVKAMLSVDDKPVKWAVAGENVSVSVADIDIVHVCKGSFLCAPDAPIPFARRIEARVVVFDIAVPITIGFPVIFHMQSIQEQGYVTRLAAIINKTTGEVVKKAPRCLGKFQSALVEITLDRAVGVEAYDAYRELGRFTIRKAGQTIAAGMVTRVLLRQ